MAGMSTAPIESSTAGRARGAGDGGRPARVLDRLASLVPVVLIAVAVIVRLPTMTMPLLERHDFRQTQTAYTARIFHTDGIDLFHPELPVFGPPWQVPFEFPLFQAGAAVLMDLGVEETLALRGFSLFWFVVSAGLLYALVRPRVGRLGANAALIVFLFTPLGIVWSRTSMIEYLAVAASLGFALAALAWRERGGGRWWALAATLGSIAMLVKITSAVFWVVPFALLGFARDRDAGAGRSSWRSPAAWGLVVVPLAIGLLWTRHADAIKAATAATTWATSANLITWNFGTLEQRLDPAAWWKALRPTLELTAMDLLPLALVVTAWFAVRAGQWRFWAWVAIAYAAPVVVFFNLYVIHDYYSAAIAPAAAAIVGAAVGALAGVRRPLVGIAAAGGLLVLAVAVFAVNTATRMPYALTIYRPLQNTVLLDLAAQIAAETRPDQPVAILGRSWNPALLYFADRRGYLVRGVAWPAGLVERFLAEGWAVYDCPRVGEGADTCTRVTTPPE
jgi:4-amino-4-deoxy-L-arabinose transferase-like glycosyltransferase